MKQDSKRKGTQPMPPVLKKLGPGVVLRPRREEPAEGTKDEQSPEYQPSEQVFRRRG